MRESRSGLLGWTIGVTGAVLLYMPFYPSVSAPELIDTVLQMFSPEVSALFGR